MQELSFDTLLVGFAHIAIPYSVFVASSLWLELATACTIQATMLTKGLGSRLHLCLTKKAEEGPNSSFFVEESVSIWTPTLPVYSEECQNLCEGVKIYQNHMQKCQNLCKNFCIHSVNNYTGSVGSKSSHSKSRYCISIWTNAAWVALIINTYT